MADGPADIGSVIGFYDTHPINEQQILHKLADRGVALDELTAEILQEHDQDHFGGLEAVDDLARAAGIDSSCHVLDVCSGVGGPARYLARRHGCRVTGLDITESRHEAAVRLTRMVGLHHWVDFRLGNALEMPFADASFDVVIGQEAWAHVPDKPRLIAECARVVRPGGRIAFTDIVRGQGLSDAEEARLGREMTFLELASADDYARLLEAAGCSVIERQDLGERWADILRHRLEMYRDLKTTTIERFGSEHFRRWDDAYAFFVGLYGSGRLSGARIVARR
jgi:SAM-dependent methyltransferase